MPLIERETREQEPVTMHPSVAEIRAGRIILAIAVVLAFGILALGINSWLTRGQRAASGPAAVATASPVATARTVPTQAVVAATTSTPAPAPAATTSVSTTAPPTSAPTATTRPATAAATEVPPTPVPTMTTRAASSGATATPDLSGPGHVPELDPAEEGRRTLVATVGDGGLGDRVAGLLNRFYPLVTRAYAENNPELLRPFLDDDAYSGYVRDIKRTNAETRVLIPVISYRIQPTVLSNLEPNSYAINVAEIQYERVLDATTRQVLRTSRPYRECSRWYLKEVQGTLKIEGATSIPERYCDAGWPEPPTPTKE